MNINKKRIDVIYSFFIYKEVSMKNKKVILIVVAIILILAILISIFAYKFLKNGNNKINKSEGEIIEDILNIKSYKAKLEIEVESNKNKTKYVVKQELKPNNVSIQEIIEPSNIAGVITEYDGTNLKIINNKLELTTTFENYSYIADNSMWLYSFIESYKDCENSKVTSKENEIILEFKDENNTKYTAYKKLYIDKKTRKTY